MNSPCPTRSLPSVTLNSSTERLLDGAPPDVGAVSVLVAARLERIHFPLGPLSSVIDGSSNVRPVMFSCFEKMSGINSTPIFKLFAVRKGDVLNAGSSAMRIFAAETLPLKIDKLKS